MSSITPTIGRKVYFYGGGESVVLDDKQAFDASIAFVNEDGTVNLSFFDHGGDLHRVVGVGLRDPSDADCHSAGYFATWMPYQVGQAKAATAPPAP